MYLKRKPQRVDHQIWDLNISLNKPMVGGRSPVAKKMNVKDWDDAQKPWLDLNPSGD